MDELVIDFSIKLRKSRTTTSIFSVNSKCRVSLMLLNFSHGPILHCCEDVNYIVIPFSTTSRFTFTQFTGQQGLYARDTTTLPIQIMI